MIDVRHNMTEIQARYRGVQADISTVVAPRALNRTITSVRAEAARDLKKYYGSLGIAAIKAQMKFIQASRSKLSAELRFGARRIRLLLWKVMQTPAGIRGSGIPDNLVTSNGTPITAADLAHAFMATTHKGVPNVWLRRGRARMPIDVVLAPSLSQTYVEQRLAAVLEKYALDKFEINYSHELQYRLSQR